MTLQELMTEFVQALDLDARLLDPDGGVRIVIDEDLAVDVGPDESGGGLIVSAALGAAPASDDRAIFAALLAANLDPALTAGGALALDRARGELVLQRTLPLEALSVPVLDAALAEFVDAAAAWRTRTAEGTLGTDPDTAPASLGPLRV